MYACIHQPGAAALAQSFSPEVETIDEQTAVFSITLRQMGDIYKIPRIAVAATIEAAILAARNFPGVTVLPPGDEPKILSVLPIDALPPDPEIFQTLDLWGIRTLGDLARLPANGIAERLGPRGLGCKSWRAARSIVRSNRRRSKPSMKNRPSSIIRSNCSNR